MAFGSVTHVLGELAEDLTPIRFDPDEHRTASTDTLGDRALSLAGTVAGAVLVTTALRDFGRREAQRRQGRGGAAAR